jgi:uncharacterized protein YkwD
MRWLVPVLALVACAGPLPPSAVVPEKERVASDPVASAREPDTQSPQPQAPGEEPFASECPASDAALGRVAQWLAEGWSESKPVPGAGEIEQRLREEGAPYVWSHAWTLAGRGNLRQTVSPRLRAWLTSFDDGGERRCGFAVVERSGQWVVGAVAADALADLAPVPAQVRAGSWVEVQAELRVPFSGAKVVVLGPRGVPKAIPTSANGSSVRARFAADVEGPWLVQVLADVAHGPRPVLEASLVAGAGERRGRARQPAPGEDADSPNSDPDSALYRMLNVARQSEGLPAIAREMRLDQLAMAQALALEKARRVAHDLGGGDPEARVSAAGLRLLAVGENVAHAESVARAHRALWASPSHRANILSPYFDAIGIGVVRDSSGGVWVCELFGRFADRPRE